MPLSLSDSELQIVMSAAKPIPARDRDQFLRDVADELARYPEVGPGIVARVTSRLQREHLAPRTGHNVGSKYGHRDRIKARPSAATTVNAT